MNLMFKFGVREFTSTMQLINVELTKGIDYNQDRYMNDGLEFYKLVNFTGLTTCRFNIFQVQVVTMRNGQVHVVNITYSRPHFLVHNGGYFQFIVWVG